MDQSELLSSQAERIRASQILGRSRLINRLFDFLVECTTAGRVPKEIEVAIDAFDRDASFDPSQDAVVRVCVHKLRRKLEEFYAGPGSQEPARISMARGEYRLIVEATPSNALSAPVAAEEPASEPVPETRRLYSPTLLAAVLVVSLLGNLLLWGSNRTATEAAAPGLIDVRTSPVWAPLLDDELPIYVVVGDYYIFGEVDEFLDVKRLVRDFDINSRADLERTRMNEPSAADHYHDLNLNYVPKASAFALAEIMPVLATANGRIRLIAVSELTPAAFKTAHIVYLGFLSGLGSLREFAFAGSRFTQGETFDELIDSVTGLQYISDVGGPVQGKLRYRDYGYFSTFPGPAGNQIVIIAGTRDTTVMQTAEMVTDRRRIDDLQKGLNDKLATEALYEVYGFENTNIDARLLISANLDSTAIWNTNQRSMVP